MPRSGFIQSLTSCGVSGHEGEQNDQGLGLHHSLPTPITAFSWERVDWPHGGGSTRPKRVGTACFQVRTLFPILTVAICPQYLIWVNLGQMALPCPIGASVDYWRFRGLGG